MPCEIELLSHFQGTVASQVNLSGILIVLQKKGTERFLQALGPLTRSALGKQNRSEGESARAPGSSQIKIHQGALEMTGKKRSSEEITWWQGRRYGSGNQSFPKSCEYFNQNRFCGLSLHDLAVWECLTFVAWKFSDWKILATADFVSEGLGFRLKAPAVRRCLNKLCKLRYIDCERQGRDLGHLYLVSPALLRRPIAELMKGYIRAATLEGMNDQKDHSSTSEHLKSDLFDHSQRSKRSLIEDHACLMSDQKDHHDLDLKLFLGGAERQSQPMIEGGESELSQRSPSDRSENTKGVLTDRMRNEIKNIQRTGNPHVVLRS
jgi:hypothetical protein